MFIEMIGRSLCGIQFDPPPRRKRNRQGEEAQWTREVPKSKLSPEDLPAERRPTASVARKESTLQKQTRAGKKPFEKPPLINPEQMGLGKKNKLDKKNKPNKRDRPNDRPASRIPYLPFTRTAANSENGSTGSGIEGGGAKGAGKGSCGELPSSGEDLIFVHRSEGRIVP